MNGNHQFRPVRSLSSGTNNVDGPGHWGDQGGSKRSASPLSEPKPKQAKLAWTPQPGEAVDVLDADHVWSSGRIIRSHFGGGVTVAYLGWGVEWNERIHDDTTRVAPRWQHCRAVKCFIDTWPRSSTMPRPRKSTTIWPAVVHFRLPQNEGGEKTMRNEKKLFCVPYSFATMPWAGTVQKVDGGYWVPHGQVQCWEPEATRGGTFHKALKLAKQFDFLVQNAIEIANQDTMVSVVLEANVLEPHSALLQDEYSGSSSERDGRLRSNSLGASQDSTPSKESEANAPPVSPKRPTQSFTMVQKKQSRAIISPESVLPSASRPSKTPTLWEIYSLEDRNKRDHVMEKIREHLPSTYKQCSQEVIHFFLFCLERQRVWEKRNRGDWEPWTKSRTLSIYKFCNVYRELDRGTNYFRAAALELRVKHQGMDGAQWLAKVLWASVCYRLCNKIETFATYGGIPEVHEAEIFIEFVAEAKKKGVGVFAHSMSLKRYKQTLMSVSGSLGRLVKEIELIKCGHGYTQACFSVISSIKNVAPYLAWQVTCDLIESKCLKTNSEDDFTFLGGGAVKVIDLIFEKPPEENQLYLTKLLQKIQTSVYTDLEIEAFPRFLGKTMSLKNIEHALREFNKYVAIQKSVRQGISPNKQLRRQSRASVDVDQKCECGEAEEVMLCDLCLMARCGDCDPKDQSATQWVCSKCQDLENISFS